MYNVKKVKAGELAIKNNDKESLIKCCKFIWPVCAPPEGDADFYISRKIVDWVADFHTYLPTILATELLKEIEAGEQNPESRISELTAQKEAIEAEIEKLKDSKKFNAERALAGEPCECMDGTKVLAIYKNPINKNYQLYALLEDGEVRTFTIDGLFLFNKEESKLNLKMS